MTIRNVLMECFFPAYDACSLRARCPNQMLWEAVDFCNSKILTSAQAMSVVESQNGVYCFTEPFRFVVSGTEIPVFRGNAKELTPLFNMRAYSQDPLYLLAEDFSWLLIFTAEPENGKELIAFVG